MRYEHFSTLKEAGDMRPSVRIPGRGYRARIGSKGIRKASTDGKLEPRWGYLNIPDGKCPPGNKRRKFLRRRIFGRRDLGRNSANILARAPNKFPYPPFSLGLAETGTLCAPPLPTVTFLAGGGASKLGRRAAVFFFWALNEFSLSLRLLAWTREQGPKQAWQPGGISGEQPL